MGEYLRNTALTLMGQLGIGVADIEAGETAHDLYVQRGAEIKAKLHRMRPETLGRIIACGQNSMRDLRPLDGWVLSGRELLREVACMVIVAEMADILLEEMFDEQGEFDDYNEFPDVYDRGGNF